MADSIIEQLSPYRFAVTYLGHAALLLDFQPLSKAAIELCPCQNFVLQHWQAKPRDLRQFGVFTRHRDGSSSYKVRRSAPPSRAEHYPLQVAEGAFVPSAAIFYPDALVDGDGVIYPWRAKQ
jgi:hypothetical protein